LQVAFYLLFRLDAWLAQRWLHKLAVAEAAHIAEQAARDAAPPTETTLRVAGTQALPRNQFRRVARFGLAADRTVDLLMYASEHPVASWPRHVNDLLRMLYRKGQARGPRSWISWSTAVPCPPAMRCTSRCWSPTPTFPPTSTRSSIGSFSL
jgi:hypothetical protein